MNDPARDSVKKILESFGFLVEIIPENPQRRQADLRVIKDRAVTYVEVKSRLEDEKAKKILESVTPGASPVTYAGSAGKRNHFSRLVEDASQQLATTAADRNYRVLWFVAIEIPGFVAADEQMKATLLGTRHIFCKRNGKNLCLPCYYAGFGDFYRYRDIDGVVIQNKDGAILVVNEFSPRINKFQESPLYRHFAEANAVREASREEKESKAYLVDGDVDRRDDAQVLAFLRQKYPGIEFLGLTDLKTAGAIIAVPAPRIE